MLMVGAVLSTVYVCPAKGRLVLIVCDKPVALARFNTMEPSPVPVFTGTVHVTPLSPVVGVPTLAPLTPDVVSEKLLAVTPVVAAPKVNV